MRRAAGIVTLSETMREDILARGGISPEVVTVVPNAVDIAGFTPGPRDEALAQTLGIEPDETVIGYISSFTSYEGIVYLIEAAALLRERGRKVRLLLVGDGEDRANLEAAAERTGLAADGGVIFTGRVPHREIARYYRTIDVFVVPRTNDRVSQLVTPLKPYEAMAMEKALVVSAVGALARDRRRRRHGPHVHPRGLGQPGRRHRTAARRPGRAGAPWGSRARVGRHQSDVGAERAALPRAVPAPRRGVTRSADLPAREGASGATLRPPMTAPTTDAIASPRPTPPAPRCGRASCARA